MCQFQLGGVRRRGGGGDWWRGIQKRAGGGEAGWVCEFNLMPFLPKAGLWFQLGLSRRGLLWPAVQVSQDNSYQTRGNAVGRRLQGWLVKTECRWGLWWTSLVPMSFPHAAKQLEDSLNACSCCGSESATHMCRRGVRHTFWFWTQKSVWMRSGDVSAKWQHLDWFNNSY